MKKMNVAIITGGNVAERGISLKSGATVFKHLDDSKYNKYLIELSGKDFIELESKQVLDKNDFSLTIDNQKVVFDLAFLMLHGHPAEDGCLQGYFEIIGLPYTGCDHFVSALTFNKQACKDFLRNFEIPMAGSVLIYKDAKYDISAIEALGLPIFVKPNKNGSSYGITKVSSLDDLDEAMERAFQFDKEVIIEQFLEGNEYSNGVVRKDGEIVVLPITEIIPETEFFDYQAKYENKSQEITPANLSESLKANCQALSYKLYEVLGCKGMSRFDYILVNGSFYFLEANTIPGMSEQSIIPQQAKAHGWSLTSFLDAIVEEAVGRHAKTKVG